MLSAAYGTIRRFAFFAFLSGFSLLFVSQAFAQVSATSPVIFDVRRSLPMEPNEPVYHDFYISAGPEDGFKKGAFVTVVRQVPVHDPIQNKQQATLNVKIARLQIIHSEHGLTVGRLDSEFDDDERPTVEFESVMIGDRIDMSTMTSDSGAKKKHAKPKTADQGPAEEPAKAVADEKSFVEKAVDKATEKSADKVPETPAVQPVAPPQDPSKTQTEAVPEPPPESA